MSWGVLVCLGVSLGIKTDRLKKLQNVSADNKDIRLFVICALRVNICKVSVYTTRTFMKCTQVCSFQKAYQLFTKL